MYPVGNDRGRGTLGPTNLEPLVSESDDLEEPAKIRDIRKTTPSVSNPTQQSGSQTQWTLMWFKFLGAVWVVKLVASCLWRNNAVLEDFQHSNEQHESVLSCTWTEFRLPKTNIPTKYDLEINISRSQVALPTQSGDWWVEGRVDIDVEVLETTKCLVLHTDLESITITQAWIEGSQVPVTSGTQQIDQVILGGEFDLQQGSTYGVSLAFRYQLRQGLTGFYLTKYLDNEGEEHVIATTKFEPTYARRAFPCFDEPALKAPFNLLVTAPDWLSVLSNMPPADVTYLPPLEGSPDSLQRVAFRQTPPMSTYLLAWVVGEMTSLTTTAPGPDGDRDVSVWGGLHRSNELLYALSEARDLVLAQEALLGVPYPLPKLDLVAIPEFQSGAMENWGLITFREKYLLLDPEDASVSDAYHVTDVVSHEMVHQWCGDLVGPSWWGDLWLNEGFATYFESYASALVRPDYGFMENFYATTTVVGLEIDAQPSVHPMYSPPADVDYDGAIKGRFDSVSYEKAAAVIRMFRARMAELEGGFPFDTFAARLGDDVAGGDVEGDNADGITGKNVVGEDMARDSVVGDDVMHDGVARQRSNSADDPFMRGLREYLLEYSFVAATTEDLWTAMAAVGYEEEAREGLVWSSRAGFPVVTVREAEAGGLEVVQRSMSGGRVVECGEDGEDAWPVSVQEAVDDDGTPATRVLLNTCGAVPLPLSTTHGAYPSRPYLLLNPGRREYQRVNYGPLWTPLLEAVAAPDGGAAAIPAADFAGLLDDAFFLAENAEEPVTGAMFMELAGGLGKRPGVPELQSTPWKIYIKHHAQLQRLIPPGACADRFAQFAVSDVVAPFLDDASGALSLPDGELVASRGDEDARGALLTSLAAALESVNSKTQVAPFRLVALLSDVFAFAARLGDPALCTAAWQLVVGSDGEIGGPLEVPPDLRVAALLAVLNGPDSCGIATAPVYEYVQRLYEAATSAAARDQLQGVLYSVTSPELVCAALQYALSPAIGNGDFPYVLRSLASRGGRALQLTWCFVRDSVPEMMAKSGEASVMEQTKFALKTLSYVAQYLADEALEAEVVAVLREYQFWEQREMPLEYQQALDSIGKNVVARQQLGTGVCDFLGVPVL